MSATAQRDDRPVNELPAEGAHVVPEPAGRFSAEALTPAEGPPADRATAAGRPAEEQPATPSPAGRRPAADLPPTEPLTIPPPAGRFCAVDLPPAGLLKIPPPAGRFRAADLPPTEPLTIPPPAGRFCAVDLPPATGAPPAWPPGGQLPPAAWPAVPPVEKRDAWLTWKVWGVLMGLCLVGSLVGVPYALAFLDESLLPPGEYWYLFLYIAAVITQFLPCLPSGALGLWLGEKAGLGAPLLRSWLSGEKGLLRRYGWSLGIGLLAGLAVGVPLAGLTVVSALLLPLEAEPSVVEDIYSRLTPLKGLGGSLMAGVTEEVWFRLGLMTLIVFALNWLTGRKQTTAWVAWLANVLAVLPFGLLHLTNVSAIGAPINLGTTALVVVLNGGAGIVFGWLYWRRGLEAAMLAHFSMDVVLHVLAPMLVTGL